MTALDKYREQIRIARETGTFVVQTVDEAQALLDDIFVTQNWLWLMNQVTPDQAISNLYSWLALIGPMPAWIANPTIDQVVNSIAGLSMFAVLVWFIWPLRQRLQRSPIPADELHAQPLHPVTVTVPPSETQSALDDVRRARIRIKDFVVADEEDAQTARYALENLGELPASGLVHHLWCQVSWGKLK